MKTVLIIVPQGVSKREVTKSLKLVLDQINDEILASSSIVVKQLPKPLSEVDIMAKNLIKKLGHPTNVFIMPWMSKFWKCYYDVTDNEITQEVVEYFANLTDVEIKVLNDYNLEFLPQMCRDACTYQ